MHKENLPLRPIVSSVGSITYNSAKYLAKVLSPLVGKTEHFVKNSQHFVSLIKNKRVEEDEVLISYDVSALFTSVPVNKALTVIHERLVSDETLVERTPLSASHVTKLLEICLQCTYFTFDGAYYLQIHGAAMGSPVSPIVCNLYMEYFEKIAISTAPHPPGWWFRYVDDTHTKQKSNHVKEFTDHINSIDPDIKFTIEKEEDSKLAFLDTYTVRNQDGSLSTTVYRKPTHTDQYLDFHSHHPEEHKIGVVRTLHQRATAVTSDPNELNSERQHINKALRRCHYPEWAIGKGSNWVKGQTSKEKRKPRSDGSVSKGSVIMPYVKGTSEVLRRVFNKHNINVCFKPHRTIRQILVHPKDKAKKSEICGPIYHIQCGGRNENNCSHDYIGEIERTLKARFMEHRRPSSTTSEVSKHINVDNPGHEINLDEVKILDRESSWYERGVKEAIYIRALRPSLNRDGGRFQLPHIWDPLLTSLSERC